MRCKNCGEEESVESTPDLCIYRARDPKPVFEADCYECFECGYFWAVLKEKDLPEPEPEKKPEKLKEFIRTDPAAGQAGDVSGGAANA